MFQLVIKKEKYFFCKNVGNFFLFLLIVVGKFSLTLVEGAINIEYATSSNNIYVSSFSYFGVQPFEKRIFYPTSVSFISTDTEIVISPVPTKDLPFPPWHLNYPVQNWQGLISSNSNLLWPSIRLKYLPPTINLQNLHNCFIFSRIFSLTQKIRVDVYSNLNNLFQNSILSFEYPISNFVLSFNQHALIPCNNKIFLLWVEDDYPIKGIYFTNENDVTNFEYNFYDHSNIAGIDGISVFDDNNNEFVIICYPSINNDKILLRTFDPNENIVPNQPPTIIASIAITSPQTIVSSNIAITQNSRTKDIFLAFTGSSGQNFLYIATISHGIVTITSGPIEITNIGQQTDFNTILSLQGCNNFETFLAVNRGNQLYTFVKYDNFAFVNNFDPPQYFSDCCIFTKDGSEFLGLLLLNSANFYALDFYYKPLSYPNKAAWNINTRELYLEGPPKPNTNVKIYVTFPEININNCFAATTNASGGLSLLANATNVIASASHATFTITFDTPMLQASYSEWIENLNNSLIKLYDSNFTQIPLKFLHGDDKSIYIGLLNDLTLDSTYFFYIASNVLSSNKTQIWQPATITFKTQSIQANVLGKEVLDLKMFSDSNYSQEINNNSEINYNTTIYFQLTAIDPAPNTIDIASLAVIANSNLISSITLIETDRSSGIFKGSYTINTSLGSDTVYRFLSASDTLWREVFVTFPKLVYTIPENGSSSVSLDQTIIIRFSEDIDPNSLSQDKIKVWRDNNEINFTYYLIGSSVFIVVDDQNTGKLLENSTYTVDISQNINDLKGNPFIPYNGKYSFTFKTLLLPKYETIIPASDSEGIYLDQTFRIRCNKDISTDSAKLPSIELKDVAGNVYSTNYNVEGRDLVVECSQSLGSNTEVILHIKNVYDYEGMRYDNLAIRYKTRSEEWLSFSLYKNSNYDEEIGIDEEVNAGVMIWLRLNKTKMYEKVAEVELVDIELNGEVYASILATEVQGEELQGWFISPKISDVRFRVYPRRREILAKEVKTARTFYVSEVTPASGSVDIASNTLVRWVLSRELDTGLNESAISSLFSVVQISSGGVELPVGIEVNGVYTISDDRKVVSFRPNEPLVYNSKYELRVSSELKDKDQIKLGKVFITRFSVEPKPMLEPPVQPPNPSSPSQKIYAFRNFRTDEYSRIASYVIADQDNGNISFLHLEVLADDLNSNTVDNIKVIINSSDNFVSNYEVFLNETGPNTGIFRKKVTLTPNIFTTLNLHTVSSESVQISLEVIPTPKLVNLYPASNSVVYLDTKFELTYNLPISSQTLVDGILLKDLSNNSNIAYSYELSLNGKKVTISPVTMLAPDTYIKLMSNLNLLSIYSEPFKDLHVLYKTKFPDLANFEAYTGINQKENQKVSEIKEALPGKLNIIATTSKLLNQLENRIVTLQIGSMKLVATLSEFTDSLGSFYGQLFVPAMYGSLATLTLNFYIKPYIQFKIAEIPRVLKIIPNNGEVNVSDYPTIQVETNRPILVDSAISALKFIYKDQIFPSTFLLRDQSSSAAYNLEWRPLFSLPLGSSITAEFREMYDILGQPLVITPLTFSTIGSLGIVIYEDASFTAPITSEVVHMDNIWVEVNADKFIQSNKDYYLRIDINSNASESKLIKLSRYEENSKRFLCRLSFSDYALKKHNLKNYITHHPNLNAASLEDRIVIKPGSKVTLSALELTDRVRSFYYKFYGNTPPIEIIILEVYKDKNFMEKVLHGEVNQVEVYVQVIAKDRNYFYADSTEVKIYSDSDKAGIVMNLVETGTNTGIFRGSFLLSNDSSKIIKNNNNLNYLLSAKAGDYIYIQSITDPRKLLKLLYFPFIKIERVVAWPNPVRSDKVFFSFYLSMASEVDFYVYDAAGYEVYYRKLNGKVGYNEFCWHIPIQFANGVYIYEFKIVNRNEIIGGGKRKRGKIALLR